MTIEKKYLEVLFQALKGTEGTLSLTQARIRDLSLKVVAPVLETFYNDRKKIYETFCVKDAEGNPEVKNNEFRFEKEVMVELSKELDVLLAETVELSLPFSDQVKKIIEGTEYKPKNGEAEMIDYVLSKI